MAMALAIASCGPINPNFQTWFNPAAETYTVEGSITRGLAQRPKVAYVQRQGENPDNGSFVSVGNASAGVDQRGVYTPSAFITPGQDSRFRITFTGRPRYVLIALFAWDDINDNGVRDVNEPLANSYEVKKYDQNGWKYNAPDWNQFNFTFTR